jgi:hypothetical protein
MHKQRAYMLSTMGHQHLLLQARFSERYAHAWLVWEPSAWAPPRLDSQATMVPTAPVRPLEGDALCYALKAEPGAVLKVGRVEETNDLAINDVTVSRSHLLLALDGAGRWSVSPVPLSKPCSVDRVALVEGRATPLSNGAAIQMGGVTLTFYTSSGFVGRIQAEAGGVRPRP